jgi:hypothetical protein
MKCVFCFSPLQKNERPEHVLLNTLGGRATTRKVVCTRCNEAFGSGIDAALATEYLPFRFSLRLRDGKGRLPNPQWFDTVDGRRIRVEAGMGGSHAHRKLEVIPSAEGGFQLSIEAHNRAQFVESLENLAQNSEYRSIALLRIFPLRWCALIYTDQ